VIAFALVVAAILVLQIAVIRAAGASLVRTSRSDALRDAAEGNRKAATVAELLEERARLQPALATVVTGLLLLAVIPATWAFARLFDGWLLFILLTVMMVVLVLVSDLVPRTVGRSRPRTIAYRFARPLAAAVRIGDAANDLVSDDDDGDEPDDDEQGDRDEREMISSVLEFGDTIVREVMVARTDMITIPGAASSDGALDLVLDSGKSRLPVTGRNIDDIIGILYARDLLTLYDQNVPARPCSEIARDAYFVPETKQISELLREMQGRQMHLAVVVDEFGGTAGLVTIEDILEEIVGEIVDEYDEEQSMVVSSDDGSYLLDARLDVDDLADLLGATFPEEEWDTVGGLVLGLAGRVPREGESFEYDDLVLKVEGVKGRRVARVRVSRT
jgi:CBS domain containing-hemolysin-like protein